MIQPFNSLNSRNPSKNILMKYLYFTRLIGLMPIGRNRTISVRWYIFSFFLLLSFILFVVGSKVMFLREMRRRGFFEILNDAVGITEELVVVTSHMTTLGFRYKVVNELLQGVWKLNVSPEHFMKRTIVWSLAVFGLSVASVSSFVIVFKAFEDILKSMNFIFVKEYGYFISFFVHFQYLFLLEYLACCLKTLVKNLKQNPVPLVFYSESFEEIVHLMKLCNSVYSYQIVYLIWRMFLQISFTSYRIIKVISDKQFHEPLSTFVFLTLREILFLLSLSSTCNYARNLVRSKLLFKKRF